MEAETVKEDTQNEGAASASNQGVAAAAPAKPQEQRREDKRQRRDDRNRREDRNYELFMKAVNAAPPNQQLQIATQKYVSMVEENKKMQFYIKQSDKRHAIILKEKEQLQLEFNKTVLLKSKLENLCRELQKQNKSIKDESLHKIREEEERRKETQAKFQSTLAEISALLQQNNEKNAKLRDDNISMTEKFKTVVQQYQMREDQVDKMSKQMELESQLNAAKMQKAALEHQAERERLQVEMETLKMAVVEYRSKVNEMQGTETGLRGQLAVYTDKYDEFQSALMKSNQVFGGFKDQMEKMSKKIKTLEKESLSWKQRWESSQGALLEMCSERQCADSRLAAVQRQLAHMQSLCRTLQSERALLVSTLKEHDIERPPLPAAEPLSLPLPPPPPPHAAASDAKVDAMAVNCAQLRQSLAHLQSQLNVLTTQQTEEPAPVEKPKKNKNKKKSKKAAVEDKVTAGVVDEKTKVTTTVADEKPVAEPKTEESTNESINPKTPSVENTTEVDLEVEKADEKVLESLMEAINIADVKLCDLDAADNNMTIEEVLEAKVEEITAEPVVTETKITKENGVIEANELESPKKDNQVGPIESNDLPSPKKENQDGPVTQKTESPKSSPKKIASSKDSPKKIASPKGSPKDASKDSPKVTEVKMEEDQSAIVKSVVDSNSLIDKEIQLNL